jgi:hypothetical protein
MPMKILLLPITARRRMLTIIISANVSFLTVSIVADSIAQSQGDEGPWLVAKGFCLIAFLLTWPIALVLIVASFAELKPITRIATAVYLAISGFVIAQFLIGLFQLLSFMRRHN